jgi:hypothetical protein
MKQKLKSRGLGIPVSLERGGCQLMLKTQTMMLHSVRDRRITAQWSGCSDQLVYRSSQLVAAHFSRYTANPRSR